jgi:hypothetical protein
VSRLVVSASQSVPSDSAQTGHYPLGQREAASGDRAASGALHARVGTMLEGLVQGARSGRDQTDAEQGAPQAAGQDGDVDIRRSWGKNAAVQRGPASAQIKTTPAGDQHQGNNSEFEEFAEVADERGRGTGTRGEHRRRFQIRAVAGVGPRSEAGIGCSLLRRERGELCGDSGLGDECHRNEREPQRRTTPLKKCRLWTLQFSKDEDQTHWSNWQRA